MFPVSKAVLSSYYHLENNVLSVWADTGIDRIQFATVCQKLSG